MFQPAEESIGGARIMCEEGLIENFNIDQVFALHSFPGADVGDFRTCPGPIMAAADDFEIHIKGQGGHAASAHETVDPVAAAVQIYQALQTIVTRNVDPIKTVVISLTQIHSGTTHNVIPETAMLGGTVRTFDADVQALVVDRMRSIVEQTGAAMGVKAELDYNFGYPATINSVEQTAFAAEVAREVVGADKVVDTEPPTMGAEDFSYMIQKCPGAYVYIGNGDSAYLHHPNYNFNDEASPIGASYFVKLVESAQPLNA